MARRSLAGIEAIGINEIHWGKGKRADNFLTVIYQVHRDCRRLLSVVGGPPPHLGNVAPGQTALVPGVVSGIDI